LPRVLQAVTAPVVFHFDLPVLKNAINGGGSGKVETRVSGHEPAPLPTCGRMHEAPSVRSAGRCLVESLRELVCRDEVRTRAECPAHRTVWVKVRWVYGGGGFGGRRRYSIVIWGLMSGPIRPTRTMVMYVPLKC
jgi:hypothetical protein